MIRTTLTALLLAAPAAVIADTDVSPEVHDKITAMLAEMQCEVDAENIEVEDAGYELDDVFCADGQYDIDLDADLQVTSKRKE
ncbi:hypothetical protein P775_10725 [Puniceibacterium antarcticum]|uniref:Uncharacterized protein n=1 Tax=Puniceibacterium antarcticum TaxID=1206336 RepID=A0A2G8REX1_9RHOB|nr:PepSY domain-containing protein [Puniceibacterium antarcticum]PIL20134.1 hypothetical protein P775_10725 [Puniceibacterium antarcticum]